SRVASRGIALTDSLSDDLYTNDASQSDRVQSSAVVEYLSSSMSGPSLSVLSRWKQRISGLWLYAVQRWPL
ncbi:hypothetical protein U1Q18_036804, partial [Sarracenia purpurea var. burkii]